MKWETMEDTMCLDQSGRFRVQRCGKRYRLLWASHFSRGDWRGIPTGIVAGNILVGLGLAHSRAWKITARPGRIELTAPKSVVLSGAAQLKNGPVRVAPVVRITKP